MNLQNDHITDNIVWFYKDTNRDIFSKIYERNSWGSRETVSGNGSNKASTKNILKYLPEIFAKYDIKTLLDAPCGDYIWMKNLEYKFDYYLGADVVCDLIKKNRDNFSSNTIEFVCADITKDTFKKFDAILCRDCFIHLTYQQIFCAVENFKKSGSTYFFATTYENVKNEDIYTGAFRKIDLTQHPFNFSRPIAKIEEDRNESKYLALWRAEDL